MTVTKKRLALGLAITVGSGLLSAISPSSDFRQFAAIVPVVYWFAFGITFIWEQAKPED